MDGDAEVKLVSLCDTLARASKRTHSVSNGLVNARLVVLFTDRQLWGRALSCFWHVFKALEHELIANKGNADLAAFGELLQPGSQLLRTPGFAADLAFFLGPGWEAQVSPAAATVQAYVQHLHKLGQEQPSLLLAHVYTQHLAMTAGGQAIKRQARKRLRLPETEGTAAFDYGQASPNALRLAFKQQLDTLGLNMTADIKEQMIEEHLLAFHFNNQIIRSFHVGWRPFLVGMVKLMPVSLALASIAAVGSVLMVLWWKGGAGGVSASRTS